MQTPNTHINCLKKACDNLKLRYEDIDKHGIFVMVYVGEKKYPFIANKTPFNNYITSEICSDKGYTFDLLNGVINTPRTVSYLDPGCRELYDSYKQFKSNKNIAEDIFENFELPIVVKKNKGSTGTNVFLCQSKAEVKKAIDEIFNKESLDYDYIALAQEYIRIEKEYRVFIFNQKIELVYLKDNSKADYVGNLSPLHWEGAKAVIQEDRKLVDRIQEFIDPIFEVLDLRYSGLDIAEDENGKLVLLELNNHPGFNYVVEDNGEEVLVDLYETMLLSLSVSPLTP